jgi:hypothetical protein
VEEWNLQPEHKVCGALNDNSSSFGLLNLAKIHFDGPSESVHQLL